MIKPGNFIDGIPTPEGTNDVQSYNATVRSQNERFTSADELTLVKIKALVKTSITNEQIDTVQQLFESTRGIDYESVAAQALATIAHVRTVEDNARNTEAAIYAEADRISTEVSEAIRLAPQQEVTITELGKLSLNAFRDSLRISGQSKIEAAQRLEATSRVDYERTGTAWEIPASLSGSDIMAIYEIIQQTDENDTETVRVTEDILPIDPAERRRHVDIAERAKRTVENNDASNFISYYLSERVDEVVTVEDLIRFLYAIDEKVLDNRQYRTRITTLLGPAIQGQRIRSYLNDQYDMQLQYGWRVLKEQDGDTWKIRRKSRIYRATSGDTDTATIVRTAGANQGHVFDEWEATADSVTQPVTATEDVVEVPTDDVSSMDAAPTESTASKAPEKDADPYAKLRADTAAALDQLEHDNLLNDDVMRGSYIRINAGSNILGTRTSRERLHAAGIMRIGEVKNDEMSRLQLVISHVLNGNRELQMKKTHKQRDALRIIEEMLIAKLAEIDAKKSPDA